MAIRPATWADLEHLVSIKGSAWCARYVGLVPDEIIQSPGSLVYWRKELAAMLDGSHADVTVWLAEVEAAPVGYCAAGDYPGDLQTGWVRALYVRAGQFDRGIGSTLLDAALAGCRDRGKTVATLWVLEANAPARAFYERRRFRPTGERKVIDIGAPVPEVRYARRLTPSLR